MVHTSKVYVKNEIRFYMTGAT